MGRKTGLEMIHIRTLSCISPLGIDLRENIAALKAGTDGLSLQRQAGFNGEAWYQGRIEYLSRQFRFSFLLKEILNEIAAELGSNFFQNPKNRLIISTTKAELDALPENSFECIFLLANKIVGCVPEILSNACISGVLAISEAEKYIRNEMAEQVVVVGIDVLSDFVTYGFQSLFAMSPEKCRPFSASRQGINLGEAAAAVLLSRDKISDVVVLGGASANDANHISGPSRTGEGLFRSVSKTLMKAQKGAGDIDFISAHGTATLYNDDMESQAFTRLEMQDIPLHSMKSWFGHTLGAAGIIESIFCVSMIDNQEVYASLNCEDPGTAQKLNVQRQTQSRRVNTILKTASGFGGGNASLIFQKA